MVYMNLKKALRVEGAIVPLFNLLPILSESVLKIAALKEWASKDVKALLV